MSDPMRLIDGDSNDFERLLLGAVARERPSRWQRHRMRRAVWLMKFGVFGTALNALASFGPHGIGTILLSTSLILGGSSRIEPTPATGEHFVSNASIAVTSRDPSRERLAPIALPPEATSAARATDAERPDGAAVSESTTDVKPTRAALISKQGAATRRGSELREEIQMLDLARSALRQGQAARTLSAVDQYRATFPRGAFDQEASVLRVEALQALGNRTRAVAEANAFLARNANSPHANRVQRVLTQNGVVHAN